MSRKIRIAAICSILGIVISFHNACSKAAFEAKNTSNSSVTPNTSQSTTGALDATLAIDGGAPYTQTTAVTLSMTSAGATEMYVTNDPACGSGGSWQPFAGTLAWTLGATNQIVNVYAMFRNGTTAQSQCVSANILHDNIPPAVIVDTKFPALTNVPNVSIAFHATDAGSGVDQELCIMPGTTSSVPCAGLYQGARLTDGGYLVQLSASDKAGNVTPPLPQSFTVDATPPVVTLNLTPPLNSGSAAATFAFTATDNLSGVAGFECKLDGGPYATCASPLNYANLKNSQHIFAVHAIDVAGNISQDLTYAWTIDTTLPTVMFTQTPKSPNNMTTATFAFTGTDDMGNTLTMFQCKLDGGAFAPCSSPDMLTGLTEGKHTFGLEGQDKFGIYSGELDYTWLVDLTPPTISLTQYPPALTNQTAANFVFTATDAGSGLATVTCSLDGGTPTNCATMTQTYSNVTPNTQHSFQIIATDNAGNQAMSTPYVWYIDTTPPTVRIVSEPPSISSSTTGNFVISGMDDHSPTVTLQCKLDSAPVFTACTTNDSYSNLSNGNHTFYAQAIDGAGNMSTIVSYTWTVETVGPNISFTATPSPNLETTQQGTLSYTVTDTYSTVVSQTCTLDTTTMTCALLAGTLTFPMLSAGNHTFTLTATNAAGLTSTQSDTFAVKAPTCTTSLNTTTIPTKMIFIVDMSGSNQSSPGCAISASCTDPGKKMRGGSIQAFYNDYGSKANFYWAFDIFQGTTSTALINSGSPTLPVFGNATAMQSAITTFEGITDQNDTPYMAALTLATTLISNDPDLNSASKPQYIVVFMSDGQPDGANDTSTNILNQVKTIVGLSAGRISFNTVYYGPVNATASGLLSSMASTGAGNFLNTNTNPTGLDFSISSLVSVPVTTCQ